MIKLISLINMKREKKLKLDLKIQRIKIFEI